MTKRMLIMLIAVVVILGAVFGFKLFVKGKIKEVMASMSNPPQTISTIKATSEPWQRQLEAVGSLRAMRGVDISNELAGMVDEIHFSSGDDVKGGTLLLTLRAADDIAKLHTLQANARLAKINYDRDVKQLAVQAVSQAVVDSDSANLASDEAQVAEQQAVVDKKFIKAPFSGHLGIRNVDQGQYLNSGTAIVTLQQLDTLYLDFYLPQQSISDLKVGETISAKNDAYPGRDFKGVIAAVNPRVDVATRNIQIRAELENADHKLLPGMFATADIKVGSSTDFVTLPQTAITYNSFGDTVFLVQQGEKDEKGKPKLTVTQSFIKTGETRGDQVEILSGVKAGDVVVTSGQIKLHNGSPVIINNTVLPTNDPNPKPIDK